MTKSAMRPAMRNGLRLAAVLALAMSAGACSTMASLDPTGLLSDDSGSSSSSNGSGTAPDLSTLPDKPKVATTPDSEKKVADSLAAAGTQAQYSADALRAGTEVPAPPPPPASAVPPPAAEPEPVAPQPAQTASATPPAAAQAAPQEAAPAPQAPEAAPPREEAPAAPAATQTAALPPPAQAASPASAQPAVPPDSGPQGAAAMAVSPSDAQLGFKPSTAAPLDPSIAKWVAPSIVAHYRRSARGAGIAAGVRVADSGAAAANYPVSYGGGAPVAEVYFHGNGTSLDAAARAQIRRAVQAFDSAGREGHVRIVGHATGHATGHAAASDKNLMAALRKSQARANAVAREIIREGVPAKKVLVDAAGASPADSYGPAPQGDVSGHRADIFLQD